MSTNGRTHAAAPAHTLRKPARALKNDNRLVDDSFARIFNLSPYRMGIVRVADKVIVAVNDRFVHDLGYTREEAIGRNIFDFHLNDELAAKIKELRDDENPIRDLEGAVKTKSGDERRIVTSAEYLDFEG